MTPESIELFVVLGLIYLLECAQWVPATASGFGALLPGRWRGRRPFRASARWRRGALLGSLWPPLTSPLVTEGLPFVLGPAGIAPLGGAGPHLSWEHVAAGAIDAAGHVLEVAGLPAVRLATRRLAATLAAELRQLAASKPAARGKRLEKLLDERFRSPVVRERLTQLARGTLALRCASNLLWLALFGGLPAILWTPLVEWWLEIAVVFGGAWIGTAITFELALRRLPTLERGWWPDRLHRVVAWIAPLAGMRAADLLAREAIGDIDPTAAAAALLDRGAFAERARLALVELTFLSPDEAAVPVGPATADASWLRDARRWRVERLLTEHGLDAAQLLAAPPRDEPRCRGWCPRCRTQYLEGDSCRNEECCGLRLLPFAGDAALSAAAAD